MMRVSKNDAAIDSCAWTLSEPVRAQHPARIQQVFCTWPIKLLMLLLKDKPDIWAILFAKPCRGLQ